MKKIVSLLLVLSFLLVPVSAAEESSVATAQEPLKVLTIGNSFTVDSMPLINSIALAQGDTPMVLGWLYRGGCSLKMHSSYIKSGAKEYTYYKNTNGTTESTKDSTFLAGLLDEDWDIIFLQQVSGSSGVPGDFDPYLGEMVDYINANKTNPNAEFGWNMTWGYQKACKDSGNSNASGFVKNFNGDPYTMYNAIVSTTQDKVLSRTVEVDGEQVPEFTYLTPCGTAIENARSSYFGDNLQRDTYHLNRLGRIIANYTWYAYLTGKTLTSVDLSDEVALITLSQQDRQVILESVNNAIAKPFERTLSQYTQRPAEDVYYVLDNPADEGGTVEAYHQNDPTTKVTVSYTGKVNDVGAKAFYKLVDGNLVAQRIYDSKVATVSWHNYFLTYDAQTQTLITQDGTSALGHGTSASKCGFTCMANASSGHFELPVAVYDVPATTPVVDVTGSDHGISTLQDVIDLSDEGYNIRLNHYSADATAPAAFYVDEITTIEDFYAPQEGDVVFIPTAVEAASRTTGYIIKSDTVAPGTKKLISVPAGSSGATGYNGSSRGRFWTMENGVFVLQKGVWMSSTAAGAYKFAYHDTITSYTPATDTTAGTIKIKHAAGHTGNGTSCGWAFENACGQTKTTVACRYRETYPTLTLSENLTIIDLTGNKCTTMEQVKALTDVENAVINVYAANGTGSGGAPTSGAVADVLVVLNPKSTFTPNSVVSVGAVNNGTVTVSPTYGQVGTEVAVTATANEGYVLDQILVDGTAISGTTFAISGNHTVTATFVSDGSGSEPEETTEYTLQDGDVIFIPTAVKSGKQVDAYIVKSATKASGSKVTVTIPTGTDGADGYNGNSRGRFWAMEGTTLAKAKGVWETTANAKAFKFTYHDTITSYTAATADAAGSIKIKHATGHTGNESNCGWNFANACGQTSASSRYRETYSTLSLSENLTIIDLTGKDYSGRGITTMDQIMDEIELGNVVVNIYAADGTNSAGTADVIVVLDPKPDFEPTVPYTMQEGDVLYLLENLYTGKPKQVIIASAKNGKPGQIETITAPNGNGSTYLALRFARVTETGELSVYQSLSEKYGAGLQYKLGVHEPLKAVDTANKTFTMGKFADGYHSNRATCFWNNGSNDPYSGMGYHMGSYGTNACEYTSFECQATNSYDANTAFMDLRTFEATGKVSDIKALTVEEFAALAGDQNVMLDVYVPDGAKSTSGTASLVVIMPTHPTKTIYNVKAGAVENGTIALSATSGVVDTEITVTATPAEGYELEAIYVDGVAIEGDTFAISGEHTVTAVFVKEGSDTEEPETPVEPEESEPVAPTTGEVYFIPGTVESAGSIVDAYVIASTTKTPGETVKLQIPDDIESNDVGGDSLDYATGRFWEYREVGFTSIRHLTVKNAEGNNAQQKFGYHNAIRSVNTETGLVIMQDGKQHRGSKSSTSSYACALGFNEPCGSQKTANPENMYGNELGPYVTFVQEATEEYPATFILDLRTGVEEKIDTLEELAALASNADNAGGAAGQPVINAYAADGSYTSAANYKNVAGHLTAVIILDTELPSDSDSVLAARRDAAEAYMRRMGTVRWRVEEDILYTISSNIRPEDDTNSSTRLELKAGRIYQGLPYTYAGGTDTSFLEYATKVENGVYTIEGITWETLSGSGPSYSRLGNDCSSSVTRAWSSIGADITMTDTKNMTLNNGYLRVGEYVSSNSDNTNSANICADNGEQTMFAAYAQLQKADGLVYRGESAGHAMMVVSNHPVYKADGTIDGAASKVTILDQTRTHFRAGERFYDSDLQEYVYPIYGIDTEMTYNYMYKQGQLPITCNALIDPAPIVDPVVTDSKTGTTFDKDSMLTGTITCNWMIDTLTMTITDANGSVVQEGAIRSARGKNYKVEVERFLTDKPASMRGDIDLDALTSGNYHCKLVCRLSSGQELTVRDFDFAIAGAPAETFAITVGTVTGGTVAVDKAEAEAGETITVTATAASGYACTAILVDGVKIEGNTFVVTGNHTVTAAFAKKTTFAGSTVSMTEVIDVNFMFNKAALNGQTGCYVEFVGPGNVVGESKTVRVEQADWGSYNSSLYKVTYQGLAAKQMGQDIVATVYNADGVALSDPYTESVRAYAGRALKSSNDAKLKTLIVDMLNYGAAAQTQFKYATDDLANNQLTAEQAALGTATTKAYTDNSVKTLNNVGSTFGLESRIELNMYFKKMTVTENTYALVKLTHHNATTETVVRIEGSDFNNTQSSYTIVPIAEMVAADGRVLVTCEVYNGDTLVAAGTDSLESYVARAMKSNSTTNKWLEEVLDFTDSAYNYLH